ncbi:MAG: TonB-dependent receptor [Ignavibacteria bacterium]|jgi:hypothetical protein|nr:TonB-dependent receptor [Ignavibacteria bacterium]
MIRKTMLLLLIVLLAAPLTTNAAIHGTLRGKVTNKKSGDAIPGATVQILGTKLGGFTKADGRITLVNVDPGTYSVRISYVGYAPLELANVRINVDEVTDFTAQLVEEGTMTEEVVVIDRRMVDNTGIGKKQKFESKDLESIARESIQSIVGMSAGVFTSSGGFNVRGARSSETQIRVDGLDVGNQFTGGFGISGSGYYPMVSSFATEEVQVLTGGFSAEYGDATGGIVNTVVKTGSTDFYEGYVRWRTDLDALWGSQSSGIQIIREGEGQNLKAINVGKGKKLQGPGEHTFEFGTGGPLPFLNKSTFYITGKYFYEKFRSNNYEVYDPIGNNLGQMPNTQSWVKSLTGRLKFSVTNDIDFILGGNYGLTNLETGAWSWLYATTPGTTAASASIPENVAKQVVANQFVNNMMVRINHRLTQSSYYEFTISKTENSDELSKRVGFEDPDFFSGFDLYYPQDDYIVSGSDLVKGKDKTIDFFQLLTAVRKTSDGYMNYDMPIVNPLTGYVEGNANAYSTDNPYGLPYFFYLTGNTRSFQFRKGFYWQLDGAYTLSLDGGENGFSHLIRTGFEARFYNLSRHENNLPWDGNPFYDVYSSDWGGNIYAFDNQNVYEKTSKPNKPMRASLYFQDQITYKGIIISPGLRFDFFDPNSTYRLYNYKFISINDPDSLFGNTSVKFQVSPRVNVAYPLTDRSNISVSYGLYFKMPEMNYLYDAYNTERIRGNAILGNPDMEAQRTNAYEINYNNQLTDVFALNISAYYRDIYNQLGMTYIHTIPDPYQEYSIAEYGNAKGVEFELRKRPLPTDHFGLTLNYTLASVIGTASSASTHYQPNIEPYTELPAYPLSEYPMSNDITHRLNVMMTFAWGPKQGPSIGGIYPLQNAFINLTGFFQSGSPYTKLDLAGRAVGEINSERGPSYWRGDLRLQKAFLLKDYFGDGAGNTSIEFFFDINNVFNRTAIAGFYTRTGDPDDDGDSFSRTLSYFSSTAYYKEADYGKAETFSIDQYDYVGNRLYSENADHDKNGIVTQAEKYQSYVDYLETSKSFRGNYQAPRTVYFGLMFRF